MSEYKHTPGPWAFAAYTKRRFGLGQAGDCALYLIQCEYGDTTIDICRNDVRLMSAAPELLDALQGLVKELSDSDDEGLIENAEPMIAARAAIAKATGAAK